MQENQNQTCPFSSGNVKFVFLAKPSHKQSLSSRQLVCIQEHEQNLQLASGKPQQRIGERNHLVWLRRERLDARVRPWVK